MGLTSDEHTARKKKKTISELEEHSNQNDSKHTKEKKMTGFFK